jgi:hypothetical protein
MSDTVCSRAEGRGFSPWSDAASGSGGPYDLWTRGGRAKQAAEKLAGTVILSFDSLAAAHDRQKLGPRKGSADLFFRSAAFPCPSGTSRGPKEQVRATSALKILRARSSLVVYPERHSEILRCAQNDSEQAQDDCLMGISAAGKAPPPPQPQEIVLIKMTRH